MEDFESYVTEASTTDRKMEATTKVEILREGRVRSVTETECQTPEVVLADTSGIFDFSKLRTKPANECIYCGSQSDLSREHVLPYALGGTVTIPRGSCERCRNITHAFETAVLRGPMQMVRYIQNSPSRSKHRDVPLTIPVKLTLDGREVLIDTPRGEAPILLPFPVFGTPDYLKSNGSELKLVSVVTGSFGADLETFARQRETKEIEIRILQKDAIAFAQMVAKIAYATAYVEGILPRLHDKIALVRSVMEYPNTIGRFVGTLPPPFEKYPGIQHRIAFKELADSAVLGEVQLFASAGAPTYLIHLGYQKGCFS
jgi:hypothetical protein